MNLDFNFSRVARAEVSPSAPVQDKQEDKLSAGATKIVFVHPAGDGTMAARAEKAKADCVAGNVSCENVTLENGQSLSQIKDLRRQGKIGDQTQIYVNMHGKISKETNEHRLSDGNNAIAQTLDFVKAVREPLQAGEEPCAATIYISSCHVGHDDVRKSMQELHNHYKKGVCFLLTNGGASVHSPQLQKVLIDSLTNAERSNTPLPDPEHLFGLLASKRTDCITMVVANEPFPRVVHAPKTYGDLGGAKLADEIDMRAEVRDPEAGLRYGLKAESQERPDGKPKVSGGLEGL